MVQQYKADHLDDLASVESSLTKYFTGGGGWGGRIKFEYFDLT